MPHAAAATPQTGGTPVRTDRRASQSFFMGQASGTAALDVAGRVPLDLIILDLGLPDQDGLTVIRPEDVQRIMETLPIKDLCGIGRKMERHLNMMSIYTCGELGRCDEARLTRKFGIIGRRLKEMGQGIDNSLVIPR